MQLINSFHSFFKHFSNASFAEVIFYFLFPLRVLCINCTKQKEEELYPPSFRPLHKKDTTRSIIIFFFLNVH